MFLSGKTYFYKGVSKVKVVTESEGYWLVEALEDFVDCVDGERVSINAGERRLVSPDVLSSVFVSQSVKKPDFERLQGRKIQGFVEDSKDGKSSAGLSGR